DDIEAKFEFLRLCSGHWKVDAVWKKNYHSWKTTFRSQLKKSTGDGSRLEDGRTRQQCSSGCTQLDNGVTEIESGNPQPKKKAKRSIEKGHVIDVLPHLFLMVLLLLHRHLIQPLISQENATFSSKVGHRPFLFFATLFIHLDTQESIV